MTDLIDVMADAMLDYVEGFADADEISDHLRTKIVEAGYEIVRADEDSVRVPKVPTPEMKEAFWSEWEKEYAEFEDGWTAALQASAQRDDEETESAK